MRLRTDTLKEIPDAGWINHCLNSFQMSVTNSKRSCKGLCAQAQHFAVIVLTFSS